MPYLPPAVQVKPQRWRRGEVEVDAVRLNVLNVSGLEFWVYRNGGAVAGLCAVASGPLDDRCLHLGRLGGAIDTARPGDFVCIEPDGYVMRWDASAFLDVHELLGFSETSDAGQDIAVDSLCAEEIKVIVQRALAPQ